MGLHPTLSLGIRSRCILGRVYYDSYGPRLHYGLAFYGMHILVTFIAS